jgi:hypothetical protein
MNVFVNEARDFDSNKEARYISEGENSKNTEEFKKTSNIRGKYVVLNCMFSNWLQLSHKSWVGSVGIMTGYRLDGWGLIPSTGKIFLFSIVSSPALGPTQPPIQWVLGPPSPKVKQQGNEVDRSPLSNAKVKNVVAVLPLPHTSSWHGA